MDVILLVVCIGALWAITPIVLAVTLGRVAAKAEHEHQMDLLYRDTRADEVDRYPSAVLSDS